MERDRFEKMVSRLLREAGAPGAEHERLLAELAEWAASMNYKEEYTQFTSGTLPDVLRRTSDNEFLFVGDAKDAENEDATNGETLKRVQGHFHASCKRPPIMHCPGRHLNRRLRHQAPARRRRAPRPPAKRARSRETPLRAGHMPVVAA